MGRVWVELGSGKTVFIIYYMKKTYFQNKQKNIVYSRSQSPVKDGGNNL